MMRAERRQLDKIVCNRSEANGMKLPGLERPIAIARNANRVRVTFAGQVIADTTRALTLREAGYPPVQYIPRADVAMRRLIRTTRASHCPFKADASYFSIVSGGTTADNAVWSYEKPLPAMAEIAGYLAFYPNRVDKIEEISA
jgi:uncharacterized protein (DUF427 family)